MIANARLIFWLTIPLLFWSAVLAYGDAERATIKIWASEGTTAFQGSGVTIASDGRTAWAVTCAHVVVERGKLFVCVPDRGWRPAELLQADRGADLALIRFAGPAPAAEVRTATLPDGATVELTGYPNNAGQQPRRLGVLLPARYTDGSREAAVRSFSGDSGGGVFDGAGRLAGIVWGGAHGHAFFRPIAVRLQSWCATGGCLPRLQPPVQPPVRQPGQAGRLPYDEEKRLDRGRWPSRLEPAPGDPSPGIRADNLDYTRLAELLLPKLRDSLAEQLAACRCRCASPPAAIEQSPLNDDVQPSPVRTPAYFEIVPRTK